MNILSLFPLIPLVMMLGLWISKNTRQIHAVMVAGSSALLALAIYLVFHYLGLREAGATDAMLLTDSVVWYAPLNIHYAVGVDGISVAMLLLSAIIVFTGTFASWQMKSDVKAYFLWFCLLSVGVFGFFITVDLFSMFMFYEVALIPMYLLIGVWGSGRKEYSAMKLTLMLMGGSALLLCGILGIYFGAGAQTMNLHEIAALHNIPLSQQYIWFPMVFVGFGVLGALFPFHTWVPDAYAYSTPTSAAVLSSLVSKGYIFLLMKIMYRVIGLDVIVSTGIQDVLFVFALVGMVMGSISAIRQTDIRRMIAFSSVAQIGYVFMGIGLGTDEGMMAATFHIFSHAVCKSMLFLAAGGLADASNNSKKFRDLRGAGFRSPIAGVAFTIGALSMVGFPFLGGFASKLNFALAAMDVGGARTMLVLITLAISTWLNTLYFLRTVITLYRKPVPGAVYSVARGQRGFCFNASLVAFSIVNVALGLFAQTFVSAITAGLATFG